MPLSSDLLQDSMFLMLLAAIVALGFAIVLVLAKRSRAANDAMIKMIAESNARANETATGLMQSQAELAGRLNLLNEAQSASQTQLMTLFQNQEREITRKLEDRLADVGKKVGDSLEKSNVQSNQSMTALKERLAVIDAAQRNITELSTQMVGLQDILSNKQARGAFGEIQLNDLVSSILPPSAYQFQATVGDGKRADCLLTLPNPPGAIVVDAKFPLESFQAMQSAEDDQSRDMARRSFDKDVRYHVKAIAEKYIVPGETADSALMFLPSEAIYAELHANFPATVEHSFRSKVWIVSPTTLMATLNTVRAVLKDARMREQAGVIQKEVHTLLGDVGRLDDRVGKLQRHFGMAEEDLRKIQTSTDKITKRGERIQEIEVGDDQKAEIEAQDLVGNVERLPRRDNL